MGFCGIVESFGGLRLVKEKGFYFWQKPKVAKAFTHLVRDSVILCFACKFLRTCTSCEILGVCALRVRFFGFALCV